MARRAEPHAWLRIALAFAACAGGLLAGCGESTAPATSDATTAPSFSFSRAFGDGPVRLVLRLESTEISLADRLILEEELRIAPGFESEMPEYLPEDFEGFVVVAIRYPDGPLPERLTADDTTERDADGFARFRKHLILEPEKSGTLAIAPLAVYYNAAGEDREELFLTEEIPVTVSGIERVENLRPSELPPPVRAPERSVDPRLAGSLVALAAAVFLTGLVWYLRRTPPPPPPPPPPHEVAWESLRRLVAQNFVERGEIELFFVHLSLILRRYIEGRFRVDAPDRTTEEFLLEASRASELDRHRDRLESFLVLSDQVKFARFEPHADAIQGAFDAVKRFIEETTDAG